ncbi:hypothetical protein KI688_009119 [Linnemannia hyalina]|uniref:Uncharacterized protein n=1 Tax=Linnemannia hyalina TaxID=64524 RepID=A0A9P7Y1K0_9FUNG|nr:hypothetical protein KI688_009119 [Linnemannia hyalina]
MSTYNSQIPLDCIASDPTSTTLYGIATGWSYAGNVKSFFLVKSSPNPDHVSLNMWSMVSEEKAIPFSYWRPSFRSTDCSVSSKGVFTAFFNNGQLLTPGIVSIPVGVRYDPETQKWTSIKTSPLYGWATDDWTHTSFYINNDGVESLVHLLTDADSTVIRFGVLNEAKNVLQLASVWKQNSKTGEYESGGMLDAKRGDRAGYAEPYINLGAFGKPHHSLQKKMIYANGRLYMMYYNHPENVTIDSIPFADPAAPPSTNRQTFKGPDNFRPKYFFAGIRGNTTFLGGLGNYNGTKLAGEYSSFTMDLLDGIPQTPVVHTSPFYNHTTDEHSSDRKTGTVSIHENFVTVGGQLPGQNPFVVGLASEGIYEFSIVGVNGTTTLGLVNVIVPGLFSGITHHAKNLVDYIWQRNYDEANTKAKLTGSQKFGIVVACFVVLFILVKYNNRRKAKKRAVAEAQQQQHQDQDIELSARRSTMGAAVPPTTTNLAMIAYEERIANQYFTSDLPPEFATSVDYSHSTPPAYARDESQTPEYSQHPRPNTVTSLGGSAQS